MNSRLLRLTIVATAILATLAIPSASAVNVPHNQVVSANPADWTPWVNDGAVYALVQIGNQMYVGGTFTTVQEPNATSFNRAFLFALNANTGAVNRNFHPNLNGQVNALATDGTNLFVGGTFTTVNGDAHRGLVALDSSGATVSGFGTDLNTGPYVDDMVFANNLLYVGGAFTQIGGQGRSNLAALDPDTGAVQPLNVAFTGNHNGGTTHIAKLDVSPNGQTLIAIGNFTSVGGQSRDQIALLDLSGNTGSVSTWQTTRFVMQCARVFDTYIRDIDIDPTGTYFVVSTTGAFNGGLGSNTLCDTISRWELGRTGANQQPTWADYAGGDTTWSITATGSAIYGGGHFRWFNSPYRGDRLGPGGLKRRGIAAFDPTTGMPIAWNPSRSPGEGAFILYSTADGLWVGHDTNQIGGEFHPRLTFFPLQGGAPIARETQATLPGMLWTLPNGGGCDSADARVLYRVNAGGPALPSLDCGPDWAADNGSSSPFHNTGNLTSNYFISPPVDSTVPTSTPTAVYFTERYDPNGGAEMQWNFSVPSGTHARVRLYLSDRNRNTRNPGTRRYSVQIEGSTVLSNFDANAAVGHNHGTMRAFDVTSDGTITITFLHGGLSDPQINGIELLDQDASAPGYTQSTSVARRSFDGSTAGARSLRTSSIDWSHARGAFYSNGRIYYGWDDGKMYRRNFNGTTFGPRSVVQTNDLSPVYFPVPLITGMFVTDGRLYYTLRGDDRLYWRYFSIDSNLVGAQTFSIAGPGNGFDWGTVRGMTFAAGTLYLARADGTLWSTGWNTGLEHGDPTNSLSLVSSDAGQLWASRGMFVRN